MFISSSAQVFLGSKTLENQCYLYIGEIFVSISFRKTKFTTTSSTAVCVDLAKLEHARSPNHKINYCCLQSVNQKAVHMNVIIWLGFLFSLYKKFTT